MVTFPAQLTRERVFLFAAAMASVLLLPHSAAWATTAGEMIQNTAESYGSVPGLISGLAYCAGAAFVITGLMKLKAHFENPDRSPFSHGLWWLVAAGALISIPSIIDILRNSMALNPTGGGFQTAANLGGAGGGLSLDAMMIRFVEDVTDPVSFMLWTLAAVLGAFFIVTALMRLAKGAGQDGARASLGSGTLMRLVIGAILISFATSADVFTNSIFGGNVTTFQGMNLPDLGIDLARVNAAISAILVFIQLIGFIAFMRGFLMVRALADGNSGVSSAAAFTHIIGGALAINISPTLRALENTFCGGACGVVNWG